MKTFTKFIATFFLLLVGSITNIYATINGDNIIISEVEYDTTGSEPGSEWFELYNPSNVNIDISGWSITDNETNPDNEGIVTFPAGTIINSGDYLLATHTTSDFNAIADYSAITPNLEYGDGPSGAIETGNFFLANAGDELTLKDASGTIIDFVSWENHTSGWSVNANANESACRSISIDTDLGTDWTGCITQTPGTGSLNIINNSPSAPVNSPDMINTSDTGTLDTDNITANNSPILNIECSAVGNTITIYTDNPAANTVTATHVCAVIGPEEVTLNNLPDGINNITYTDSDTNGESDHSPILSITIDTNAPAIPACTTSPNPANYGDSIVTTCTGVETNSIITIPNMVCGTESGNNVICTGIVGDEVGKINAENDIVKVLDFAGNTNTTEKTNLVINYPITAPPIVTPTTVPLITQNIPATPRNGSVGWAYGPAPITPEEWNNFSNRLQNGVESKILTYVNRNGFEIFRGYISGMIGIKNIKIRKPKRAVFRDTRQKYLKQDSLNINKTTLLAEKTENLQKIYKYKLANGYKESDKEVFHGTAKTEKTYLKRRTKKTAYIGVLAKRRQHQPNKWERKSPFPKKKFINKIKADYKILKIQLPNGKRVSMDKIFR